jgi:co-chaperonin GroES (HSP10)
LGNSSRRFHDSTFESATTTALSSSKTCRIEDIPDTTQEKPQQGKVIAIGPGGPR